MPGSSGEMPKYHFVREHIKKLIIKGEIKFGDKLPSENELMTKFNVSRHTIRQALGELNKEGWVLKEQGRGTFCNFIEGSNESKIVAVITTYISNYIFPEIITGIEEVLTDQGYTMILANTNNEKEKEAKHIANLMNRGIVGLILEPTRSAEKNTNLSMFKELQNRNIKIVQINAAYEELDSSYIITDDYKGEYNATSYLAQIGHKRIAGIFKVDDIQGIRRKQGFLDVLKQNNLPIKSEFLAEIDTQSSNFYPYQFASNLLQKKKSERPTAIVCYNDLVALKVAEAARNEGLSIPEDISIIGYDDSNIAVASEIKFTTVKHPKKYMGRQAAQFLIDMIEGKVEKPRSVYEPELVVRNSCKGV